MPIFIAVSIINRLWLLFKMRSLRREVTAATWKVWRLSAVEPVITTVIGSLGFYLFMNDAPSKWAFNYGTHVVTQMSILLFIAWVWVVGKGCQRGRLVNTVLYTRFIILSAPLIAMLFGIHAYSDSFELVSKTSLSAAFVLRALFGIYQNRATPTRAQFVRQQTEAQITLATREIEDGVTLIDDPDLWDEQVALIERLKAEQA